MDDMVVPVLDEEDEPVVPVTMEEGFHANAMAADMWISSRIDFCHELCADETIQWQKPTPKKRPWWTPRSCPRRHKRPLRRA